MIERIKKMAKLSGKSIKEIETELNLGNGTIGKWEKTSPKVENILKVARYFNVSLDYIITGREGEALTEEDKRVLRLYKKLPQNTKQMVDMALEQVEELEREHINTQIS